MKTLLDNQIIRILIDDPAQLLERLSFQEHASKICFGWPSLLECLDIESLWTSFPAFDNSAPIFKSCLSILHESTKEESIFHLFDRLFAENLTQVKNLRQVDSSFLLEAIRVRRQQLSSLLIPALSEFEIAFEEHTAYIMHDLILYLAWDRMCVCLSRLFDYQSTDPNVIKGLEILQNCLIESFQHITRQGKTHPSLYRLLESLFFYQMREENLNKHTEAGWAILNQSFPVLKSQEQLADFLYIDHAIIPNNDHYLTLDSIDKVNTRLAFARYMTDKIASENPEWKFNLLPKNIICIK